MIDLPKLHGKASTSASGTPNKNIIWENSKIVSLQQQSLVDKKAYIVFNNFLHF